MMFQPDDQPTPNELHIAELEAAIRNMAHRIKGQADVSDAYSLNSGDPVTWRICNSHFRDMADEMLSLLDADRADYIAQCQSD